MYRAQRILGPSGPKSHVDPSFVKGWLPQTLLPNIDFVFSLYIVLLKFVL